MMRNSIHTILDRKTVLSWFAMLVMAMLLAACGTSKKVTKDLSVAEDDDVPENVVVRTKVTLVQNGKKMSTNGILRMKKNDVIQLSLIDPIIGITEVGRLELTKDKVLVVDRFNRCYVEEEYSQVAAMLGKTINFGKVQTAFRKEVLKAEGFSVQFKAGKHDLALSIVPDLNTLSENADWNTRTSVSGKYEKLEVDKLFKLLVR